MNVSLPADLKSWVDHQVAEGGYGTASEYVRDLLRRARERESKRALESSLVAAVEQGATETVDAQDWAAMKKQARAGAAAARSRGASRRRRSK